jgi:uncharacterized protein YjbI with pentapeptide repeats
VLTEADLTMADLSGADLGGVEGVTDDQLAAANVDSNTRLP